MRFQRRAWKGSSPHPWKHPNPSLHTSESYGAKYKGRQSLNYLIRQIRMRRRELAS